MSLNLVENTPYLLEFWVAIYPTADGSPNSAMIDPIVTSAATAGTLIFSADVGSTTPGVPEPSTWALMLLGVAGLSFAGYRKARTAASMT
jgi:hypothetical protein